MKHKDSFNDKDVKECEIEKMEFVDVSHFKQWKIDTIPENFFMLISAKRRSGKTHLLRDICYNLKNRFKQVYIFSETAHLQSDCPYDFIPTCNTFNGFDEGKLKGLLDEQERIINENKKKEEKYQIKNPILIILDDVIGDNKVRQSPTLKKLSTLGRHFKISVAAISQTISARSGFPAVLRQNCDVFVCFTLHDFFNRETCVEMYASLINKKEGAKILNSITQEKPYQVCVFDLSLHPHRYEDYVFKYVAPAKRIKFRIGEKSNSNSNLNVKKQSFNNYSINNSYNPLNALNAKQFNLNR